MKKLFTLCSLLLLMLCSAWAKEVSKEETVGSVTVKLEPTRTEQYGWSKVGIWAWVTNGSVTTNLFNSWPGAEVSKEAETGWWSYTLEDIPEGELHIIWNDFGGGNQTSDINGVDGNTCYSLTSANSYTEVECPSVSSIISSDIPTVEDLASAGYNTTDSIVLCFYFDDAPCNDVVIAGNYCSWTTDPSLMVHMSALEGFEGWYAAEIPYNTSGTTWANQAKPVQLSVDGTFNWTYQAGGVGAWIHLGGLETEFESNTNECTPYLSTPGAYIYEIVYWRNHSNPCEAKTTYTVHFIAPQGAPESVEIIGSFDNWTGTAMSLEPAYGRWTATITATSSDEFMFRGTGGNYVQYRNIGSDEWVSTGNLAISDYISNDTLVYVNFSDADYYRWTLSYPYIPYNLQAVSEPGKVVFSWEAEEVSDTYYIDLYNAGDDSYIGFLEANNTTSLTYMVQDFLDGKEIRWSLTPVSPYELNPVYAENTFVMQKSAVELSNFVLTTEDGVTLDLTWESNTEGLKYLVEIVRNNRTLWYEMVSTTEFHFTSTIPGTLDVYVTPCNADDEMVGSYSYAGSINLPNIPAPFYNLQGEADGHEISLSWEGAADSVYFQLFGMDDGAFSNIIYEGVVKGHSINYTVEEDGNYALQLRAWSELTPGEFGIGPYSNYVIVQAFTVPTYSVQIDAGEGGYVWPTGMSGNYPEGYVLTVEAYAYAGYVFAGWDDGVSENVRTIVVSGNTRITALFTLEEEYPMGLDEESEGQPAKKIFKNGNVYILRGDNVYTLTGQKVK